MGSPDAYTGHSQAYLLYARSTAVTGHSNFDVEGWSETIYAGDWDIVVWPEFTPMP
jgi:hypothetical protein